MDTSLTPLDLFSPSKAAQHRAQAQDWAFIETWLSAHYRGRAPPPFERNEDTLKALLALAAANEKAEEEVGMLNRVQREALIELEAAEDLIPDSTLNTFSNITGSLSDDGSDSLTAISRASVLLNAGSTNPETIAHALVELTRSSDELVQHIAYLETFHNHLETQLASMQDTLASLKNNKALSTPPNLSQKTAEYTRQTKHLRSKLTEYASRLSALPAVEAGGGRDPLSSEGLAMILRQEEDVEHLEKNVTKLEAQIDAFQGLPTDGDAAKRKVQKLEQDVIKLRRQRDQLFEGLVN